MIRKECLCPVCKFTPKDRVEYPLGFPIAEKVEAKKIESDRADEIVEAHHSYMKEGVHNSIVDHGIYLNGWLVGAVSYAVPLFCTMVEGVNHTNIVSVSRVVIVPDTSNLASCGMARSQELFEMNTAIEYDTELLITWVIEGKKGSMFSALKGLGWECRGTRDGQGQQPSSRPNKDIYMEKKARWICPIEPEEKKEVSAMDW